jgi:CrcB protein
MKVILAIAIGGAIGAVARYQMGQFFIRFLGGQFPYNTLFVNVLGCLLMGVFYELLTIKFNVSLEWRSFILVGILGAFTTFSTFALEIFILIERGNFLSASMYVFSSVALSLIGLFLGLYVMKNALT